MPQVNTNSELIEVLLTPSEVNAAMQLKEHSLSVMYLQNTRVAIFRQLVALAFDDSTKDGDTIRSHAYLRGQLDILENIINGALNPTPIPINDEADSPNFQPPFEG